MPALGAIEPASLQRQDRAVERAERDGAEIVRMIGLPLQALKLHAANMQSVPRVTHAHGDRPRRVKVILRPQRTNVGAWSPVRMSQAIASRDDRLALAQEVGPCRLPIGTAWRLSL